MYTHTLQLLNVALSPQAWSCTSQQQFHILYICEEKELYSCISTTKIYTLHEKATQVITSVITMVTKLSGPCMVTHARNRYFVAT